jgi:antitoxin (DNA-binding transcriptional repressor) of toxin-antitoxin stability system
MTELSIADAKDRLADLIDRALQGEEVVIVREDQRLVRLAPLPHEPVQAAPEMQTVAETLDLPRSADDLEWLRRHRVGRMGSVDAGTLVRQMRDEDWR